MKPVTTEEAPVSLPGCIGLRHLIVFMNFLGVFLAYALRVNLSVAIVAMVSHRSSGNHSLLTSECQPDQEDSKEEVLPSMESGEFEWDEYKQGVILSAFFWGYTLTQIPGGILAEKYGGKVFVGCGLLVTAICTLLTPVAARAGYVSMVAIRVIGGLGEGVMFPGIHSLLSHWSPPLERSRMFTLSYAGTFAAPVLTLPVCGILGSSDFLGGWPSIFYVFGTVGVIWFILWMFLVYNTPAEHPFLPEAERHYLVTSICSTNEQKKPSPPWKNIWMSLPMWAILVVHTGHNWFFYTLLTEMPTFMKNILRFDTKSSGVWSSLPYLAMWFTSVASGFIADWVIAKQYISTTNLRKFANVVGHVIPAAFLIGAGYTGCNSLLTVGLLTAAVGTNGLSRVGYEINHLDLSQNFAGLLMGITNCVANVPGILAPYAVGYLTNNQQTFQQWRIVFYIASAAAVAPCVFYVIYGSGERQEWDNVQETPKEAVANGINGSVLVNDKEEKDEKAVTRL